jgi:hypothetical protein
MVFEDDVKRELEELEESKEAMKDPAYLELYQMLSKNMQEVWNHCVKHKDSLYIGNPDDLTRKK